MLFISPKRSENIRLLKAAERYIVRNYDQNAWASVTRFFALFEESHQSMVSISSQFEFDENALQPFATCLRYYKSIEEKLSSKNLDLEFVWFDTLRKKKVKDSSYAFEKINLMFNLGAVYSFIATRGDFATPEGKKASMNKFLMAAGCFDKVREWSRDLPRIDSIDLTQEHCSYAIHLMTAQAYICMFEFVDKATYSKLSIGKLANAVSKNYLYAFELAGRAPIKDGLTKEQIALMNFYATYWRAAANYWTAIGEKEVAEQKATGFGAVVGRLQLARSIIDDAIRVRFVVGPPMDKGRALYDLITKTAHDAESTNINVYMDSIVRQEAITKIDELTMLVPKFPPSVDVESKMQGEECLLVLIPREVRTVMNQYKERLMEMVQNENVSAADLRNQLQTTLASLNLPQKLDALSASDAGIPEDVWGRVQQTNSHGGVLQIEKMMESLTVMNTSNLRLLEDVETMIKQEEDDDASHRAMFGPRWNRSLSQAGNAMLKQDLFKYKEKTAQATAVDRAIVQNFQTNQAALQLTRKSRDELNAMIPRAAASVDASALPIVSLKGTLEALETLQKQLRDELTVLQTMTESDNIVGEIMQLFNARAPTDQLLIQEMNKYNEIKSKINQLKAQQLETLQKVRTADRDFEQYTQSIRMSSDRVEFLRTLGLGCEKFTEMVNQLSQGMNFYKQLGQLIAQLQQRVSDFIIARNLEKNDLVARLTSGSAPPSSYGGGGFNPYQNPYNPYK